MNLDYFIKKNHIFKNRKVTKIKINIKNYKYLPGLYACSKLKFELIYLRVIKKIFRRKYTKHLMRFFKPKFWIFIKPNFLLTMKSKNSRMGAGVGMFIRLTAFVYPNKPIVQTWHYSSFFISQVSNFLSTKFKLFIHKFLPINFNK